MPNLVAYLNRTPIFEWYVIGMSLKMDTKRHVLKRNWIMCSKNDMHSKLSSQHNWGDLDDYLMSTRIYTFIIDKIFILAPEIMRKVATALIWTC